MVRLGGRNLDRGGNVNELSHDFRFGSHGRPRQGSMGWEVITFIYARCRRGYRI